MVNYEERRVKQTNIELSKLKSATKNKAGTALSITKTNFQDYKLPHELFLAKKTKYKIKNAFTSNIVDKYKA